MKTTQVRIPAFPRLICLSFFLSLPCIGFATPVGIVFVEGDKPSRVVYVADFLNAYGYSSGLPAVMYAKDDADFHKLLKEQKKVEMRFVAVYENKTAPESISMILEFQCHNQEYRIINSHAMLRDGTEKQAKQEWKPYASSNSAFPFAAAKIACDNEEVMNAAKEVAESKNGQDFRPFDKLGIIYIGDLDRFQAVDTVWNTILADGTRPAYNSKTLTDKELKELNKKLDKQFAEAKEQTANSMALASAALGDMKEEQAFKAEINTNAKRHTDLFGRESKQAKQLKWLLGKTENEIVRKSGVPADVVEAGEARFMTYYNEYFIPGVGYSDVDKNGYAVYNGTTVTCELTIELRKGGSKADFRAVDFKTEATNGGCRDFSWFNRN